MSYTISTMKSPTAANHEMNRELLWRNYPTDMRGTSLRHFWSIRGVKPRVNSNGSIIDPATDETFMDIKKIHQWKVGNSLTVLGGNTARQEAPSNMVVMAIRGELFKKYPNAMVYARKATWYNITSNGTLGTIAEFTKTRKADPRAFTWTGTGDNPYMRTPIFSARVDDMVFVGFNLSAAEAKGTLYNGSNSPAALANPGWYFVIEERAGEPVFGADKFTGVKTATSQIGLTWDVLEWGHLINTATDNFISLDKEITLVTTNNPNLDDAAVRWKSNSSDIANALYQKPTRVFLHGYDMLNIL